MGTDGHQIHNADDAWSAIVTAYLCELGLPYADLKAVRRQATDDEIRTAFVGKTVDFGPGGGIVVYRPDGRYEFALSASGGTPGRSSEGVYWIEKGQVCVESSAGMRRCDKIMKVDDAFHLINASGGQYPARIR